MCGNVPFATRLARERGVGKPFPFELGRVFSLSLVPRAAVVAAASKLSPGLSSAGNSLPRPRVLQVPLGAWGWSCSHSRVVTQGPFQPGSHGLSFGETPWIVSLMLLPPLSSVFSVVQIRSLKASCALIFSSVFHFFVFSPSTDTFPQPYPSTSPMTLQCCSNVFNFQGLIFTVSQ